jgi:hypothetical protein
MNCYTLTGTCKFPSLEHNSCSHTIRARWLPLLFMLLVPNVLQAQGIGKYFWTTNNGTITITKFGCVAGTLNIPGTITSLPVTRIGNNAFGSCSYLTRVTIPDSVTSLDSFAFYWCSSLNTVTIPNGVTNIGTGVFEGCTSLPAIVVGTLNPAFVSVDGVLFNKSQTTLIQYPGGKLGNYIIPNSVTSIGSNAFAYCTNLTYVTIPNSITNVGTYAFLYCTGLTNITIPDSVLGLGPGAFHGCTSLLDVTIPSSFTAIASNAFSTCDSLTNVTIPNSVTSIESYAFANCPSLTNVVIPSSVAYLGEGAFSYDYGLEGVFFMGNAPSLDSPTFSRFAYTTVTVYYLPGTIGWGSIFSTRPTALWSLPNPLILDTTPSFGAQTNVFGFIISWATNTPVVVEASLDLANPIWSPLGTITLTDGSAYFSDPQWTNYPSRFYRLRSP